MGFINGTNITIKETLILSPFSTEKEILDYCGIIEETIIHNSREAVKEALMSYFYIGIIIGIVLSIIMFYAYKKRWLLNRKK